MDANRRRRREVAGWRLGDASDFLGLTLEEARLVEIKLALSDLIRRRRCESHWTQAQVAELIGSSQSRVAKIEAADSSVSLDLMVKSLLSMGASREDVGRAICG
jgi:hypothetical protein